MPRRSSYPDDPDAINPRSPDTYDDLPLLAPTETWPERPPAAPAEQRGLALPESLEAKYAEWRRTEDGEAAYAWLVTTALAQVRAGTVRLFIDRLVWDYRQQTRRSLNNSYRALLVREMTDAHPALSKVFETRTRRAS